MKSRGSYTKTIEMPNNVKIPIKFKRYYEREIPDHPDVKIQVKLILKAELFGMEVTVEQEGVEITELSEIDEEIEGYDLEQDAVIEILSELETLIMEQL